MQTILDAEAKVLGFIQNIGPITHLYRRDMTLAGYDDGTATYSADGRRFANSPNMLAALLENSPS